MRVAMIACPAWANWAPRPAAGGAADRTLLRPRAELDIAGFVTWENGRLRDNGDPRRPAKLDDLSPATLEGVDLGRYTLSNRGSFCLSRGCLSRCTFCSEGRHFGEFRTHSAEWVANQIALLLPHLGARGQRPHINFDDSLINGDMAVLERLCVLIVERRLDFTWGGMALVRPEMTRDMLARMRRAGCVEICWGIESGSARVLKALRKRFAPSLLDGVVDDPAAAQDADAAAPAVGTPRAESPPSPRVASDARQSDECTARHEPAKPATSKSAEDPLSVFVLGSGRSGTSVVAHFLQLLGLSLGPADDLVGGGVHNPKGYFELQPVIDFDDEILAAFGGTWDRPPPLPPGFEGDARLEGVRARASAYLREAFDGAPRVAMKDPRLSHTVPFWRSLLPGPHKYVVALRSPLEVAASYGKSNGLSFGAAIVHWHLATAAAFHNSQGAERLVLFYEDIVQDWRSALCALAAFVGRPDLASDPRTCAEVEAFVDGALRRERSTPEQQVAHPQVPFTVAALYVALRSWVRPAAEPRATGTGLEAAIQELTSLSVDTQYQIDALLAAHTRAGRARQRAESGSEPAL